MTYTEKAGSRFDQIFIDEPLRKFLYENEITLDNYLSHQEELKKLFPDENSYQAFLHSYLSSSGIISYRQFLKESDLCLISPYVPHSSEIYSDDAVMVNLVLPAEHLQALLPHVMSYPNTFQRYFSSDQALSAEQRFLHCSTKQDPEISRLFRSLLDYYSKKKGRTVPGNLLTETFFEQIFLYVLSLQPTEEEKQRGRITGEKTLRIPADLSAKKQAIPFRCCF